MARRTSRGFSLIELLVAVAIGSAGIAAAGYVAKLAVASATRGSQVGQAVLNTQVIARQLRADLEVAGFGSTGVVGAAPTIPGQIAAAPRALGTPRSGLPVVRAADNVMGGVIGGVPVLSGTDILQLIVPDPSRATTTAQIVQQGTNCTALGGFLNAALACPLQYVSDHSGATGAGRTQLLRCGATPDALLFDVTSGADVMCARWSTYWVDTNLQLHRSDYAGLTVTVAGLEIPSGGGAGDVIAPGVADLQVALRLSSEAPGATTAAAAWAWDGASATVIASEAWFEVRQVRANVLFRTLRAVEDSVTVQDLPNLENRPAQPSAQSLPAVLAALNPGGTAQSYRFVRMTTSQVLTNQRFFDLNLPSGVPADPY